MGSIITDADLAEFQAMAEAEMDDECAVFRKIGTTTDPNTGAVVPEYATVYTGPCRIRQESGWAVDRETGQQVVTVTSRQLQVPVTATGIEVEDLAEPTTSKDPDLVGHRLRISNEFGQTHAIMRQFIVEEPD